MCYIVDNNIVWFVNMKRSKDKRWKNLPHLGNRVKDSLIRRDVSGGSEGAPLSPGVGHSLQTQGEKQSQYTVCQSVWMLDQITADG